MDKEGKEYLTKHPELQVIREADRMSFLHPEFTEHNLKYISDDKKLNDFEKLINQNYKELVEVVRPNREVLRIAEQWRNEAHSLIKGYRKSN